MLVCLALSLLCCQQTAAQDVFVSMPLLTHLTLEQELTGQDAQMLAAVRLGTLRSLDVRMDLCHASFLQGCTQLKALTLVFRKVKGVGALAELTGLTELELHQDTWNNRQVISAAEQSELGSTLAALSNLQSLHISTAPPGPVTEALSQLTGLTELTLYQQHLVPNPGPLVLPSCVKLALLCDLSIQHLACIEVPHLQHLVASLKMQPLELIILRRLCRGVLSACSTLTLTLGRGWSNEDTVALMTVLSKDWQPSAEALQAVSSSSIRLESSSSSSSITARKSSFLRLSFTTCSRQCLELLPKGLSSLDLWWVLWLYTNPCVWPTCTGQHYFLLYLMQTVTDTCPDC
jgi:hypothetical protein